MGFWGAVKAGTVLAMTVTAVWSWTAVMTIGPAPPVHLGRDLPADYAQVADAATGSGGALFAVVAAIYVACFVVSGLRQRNSHRLAARNRWDSRRRQNLAARRSVSQ